VGFFSYATFGRIIDLVITGSKAPGTAHTSGGTIHEFDSLVQKLISSITRMNVGRYKGKRLIDNKSTIARYISDFDPDDINTIKCEDLEVIGEINECLADIARSSSHKEYLLQTLLQK